MATDGCRASAGRNARACALGAGLVMVVALGAIAGGCGSDRTQSTSATSGSGGSGGDSSATGSASVGSGGADGMTGSGGAGGGSLCVPGSMVSCYSGPMGTEGTGLCAAGTQTCSADGTSLGACMGEILPAAEDCQTAADENCLGATLDGCGEHLFSKAFGDPATQHGYKVVFDGAGNVIVTGSIVGTVDFGGGPLTADQSYDTFVVKLGPAGDHLWSKVMGGVNYEFPTGAAVDSAGNVYITGAYVDQTDLGGGPLVSAGQYDMFLAKLDGATGALLSSKSFGGPSYDEGSNVAVDGAGDILVTGWFKSTINFGGGNLTAAGGGVPDIFVAKLTAAGGHLWSKRLGGAGIDIPESLAVDPSGNALVTGSFEGSVDFGGGALTSAGGEDIFVLKLSSAAGAHVFSQRAGGASGDRGTSIAADGAGNVLVTGRYTDTIDFGGGALVSAGSNEGFYVKYSPAGAHVFSQRFGSPGADSGASITADPAGNIVLLGSLSGTVDLGGGPFTALSSSDPFILKLSANGGHIWSKHYGGVGAEWSESVATNAAGEIAFTGGSTGSLDFGGGPLMYAGDIDVFVVKLAP